MNLLLVFTLFYFGFSSSIGSPCKLEKCFYGLSEIMSLKNEAQSVCGKTKETGHCFLNCTQGPSFAPFNFTKSFPLMLIEVCGNELMHNIAENAQCVSHHIYELLACFIDSSNLKPVNNNTNDKLLKCRQLNEALDCPEKVLKSVCNKSAADAIYNLLSPLLREAQVFYCNTFSIMDMEKFKVLHPGNRLRKVSKCFDKNDDLVAKCLKHIQSLDSVDGIPGVNCNDERDFIDCINFSLGPVCRMEAVPAAVDLLDTVTSFFNIPSCSIKSSSLESIVSYTINSNSKNPETTLKTTIKHPTDKMSNDDNAKSVGLYKEMAIISQILVTTETPVDDDDDLKVKMAELHLNSNFAICTQSYFLWKLIFTIVIILLSHVT